METNAINTNAAGFAMQRMEVSKKEGGKYVPVGTVEYFVPLLAAFGIDASINGTEDGLPSYADDKIQWLFNAAHAAVKAKVRNSLISGTADLKPGNSIPADFDALLAEGVRTGEGLATVRELKKAFAAYVASLGLSVKAQETLNKCFSDRAFLGLQADVNKAKVVARIQAFAEQADVELLERGQRYLQSLLEVAAEEDEEDPFGAM